MTLPTEQMTSSEMKWHFVCLENIYNEQLYVFQMLVLLLSYIW